MSRTEKTVITKDGYIIKKHTITLYKGRYYSISKDGITKVGTPTANYLIH